MSVETLIVSGAIKVGAYAYNRAMIHCKHCKGKGPCECAFGCPVKSSHKCFPFFKDRTCASCRQTGIKGSLYQCRECKNLDLCSTCYNKCVHVDHDFIEFQRQGGEPIFHDAQSKPKLATIAHLPPATPPGTAPQPPAYMHHSAPNLHCRPIVVAAAPPQLQALHGSLSGHSSSHSSCVSTTTTVACDCCHKQGNRISHHKCATCPDFDLCEACHASGFHGHHPFLQYKDEYSGPIWLAAANAPIVHSRVCCDQCSLENIQGDRYKCAVCTEFDLCQACYGHGAHGHHAFVKYARPKDRHPTYLPAKDDPYKDTAPRLPIHVRVMCDSCHRDDIVGSRYKCSICPEFDLCSQCWTAGKHGTHTFWRYQMPNAKPSLQPAKASSSSNASKTTVKAVHTNVVCDGCGVTKISGPRYSCQSCQDVDLCEQCYSKNKHGHHGFLRYEKPGAMPLYIEAQQRGPSSFSSSGPRPEESGGGGPGRWFSQLGNNLIDGAIEDSVDDLAQDFGQTLGGMFGFGGDDDDGCDC